MAAVKTQKKANEVDAQIFGEEMSNSQERTFKDEDLP